MKRDILALLSIVTVMHKYALSYTTFTNNRGQHYQPTSISSFTNRINYQHSLGTRTKSALPFPKNDGQTLKMSSHSVDEITPISYNTFYDEIVQSTTSFLNSFSSKAFMKTENELSNAQLMINAGLLISAFGFALYTIINIDHGMTRGWSHSEIMMRIPMDNWKGYEDSLSDKPIFTKTMINVIIYLLGDWLSQTIFQKRNILDFEYKRTLRNGFIGACFGPLVHQYYEFSDFILPVDVGINRVYKIFMDQTIYLTTKVGVYILAVGLLAGETVDDCVDNVKSKIKDIIFTAWKFWPLVHCVTYTVIPSEHRILWVNCVDLVWNAILALMAGDKKDDEEVISMDLNEDQKTLVDDSFLINADNNNNPISIHNVTMVDVLDEAFIRSSALMQDISKDVFFSNDTATISEYSMRGVTNDTSTMSEMDLAPIP